MERDRKRLDRSGSSRRRFRLAPWVPIHCRPGMSTHPAATGLEAWRAILQVDLAIGGLTLSVAKRVRRRAAGSPSAIVVFFLSMRVS